ncbi:MAG TPA: glycerophosphodiester phosphodiesterase [Acidimicrobiales bacterium]
MRSQGVTSVIAHRGACRAEPENTVAAFRRAAVMGADMVELDVRRSADGLLVVHHDAHLPDGRAIAMTRADDLPRSIPTLDAALDACAGMAVDVEIKNDEDEPGFDATRRLSDDVVAMVLDRGDADRVFVSSFDLASLERVRAVTTDVATGYLVIAAPEGVVDLLVRGGHQALHPWWETVDAAVIDGCHAAGLAVNVWTLDDPEAMVRLAGWGVDGICTNVPDVAVAALRAGRTDAQS